MNGLMAVRMAGLRERWREEIEQAVDAVKGVQPRPRGRTASDRWFRRMWHINKWRMRNVQGPTVTRD